MTNWCSTTYSFDFPSSKEAESFEEKIRKWLADDPIKNGFQSQWLGSILFHAGLATVNGDEFNTAYECCGSVCGIERTGKVLKIDTDTAWHPMNEMWTAIFQQLNLTPQCRYVATEPECGIFVSNDPDLYGHYIVDVWDADKTIRQTMWEIFGDSDYVIADEMDLVLFLRRALNSQNVDLNALLKQFTESDISDNLSINLIEESEF